MKVLVACEFSGIVRDAFRERGHDATSCDLLPSERPGPHIQSDVRALDLSGYDLLIAHPPCTHLAVSGRAWFKYKAAEQAEALAFVRWLLDAPVPRIAVENPVSVISTRVYRPTQIIQPWQFGHPETKATCLWLWGLWPLLPTSPVAPRWVYRPNGKRYSPNHDPLVPRQLRGHERSRTYPGIAAAMAEQWGAA